MKDIFANLYNKVFGFFQKQDEVDNGENAKDIARNRLKLVLMQDRTNLTPYLLEKMRGEMIEVLSKYVEMDKEALELNFEQEGDSMALMLSIPVLRAKDEKEIQAVIEAEEKAEKEKSEAETKEETEDTEDTEEDEDRCATCDCEYKETDMECEECPKADTCECLAESPCATCDCEYKETDMICDECPKLETCECAGECPCDDCDCEYKDSEIECEECPKSETCKCYEEFKEMYSETDECDCQDDECSCGDDCECGCHEGEECTCNKDADDQEEQSDKNDNSKKKK